MPDRLTLPQLESYLWGAATILRGLIDAGDYKQFIFPLVFYKRLSDVWDEDYEALATYTPTMRCSPVRRPTSAS